MRPGGLAISALGDAVYGLTTNLTLSRGWHSATAVRQPYCRMPLMAITNHCLFVRHTSFN